MRSFAEELELKYNTPHEKKKLKQFLEQAEEIFGDLLHLNQYEHNRKLMIKFFQQSIQEVNKKIEEREGKFPFLNYRRLTKNPFELMDQFKFQKENNLGNYEKLFQMATRRGLEQLSFWNIQSKDLDVHKVHKILEEACQIFSEGLNKQNLSIFEFWISYKLKKLKEKDQKNSRSQLEIQI